MSILKYFKDNQTHSFDELQAVSNLDVITLTEALDELIHKKRIEFKDGIYQLKHNYRIGILEIKKPRICLFTSKKKMIYTSMKKT